MKILVVMLFYTRVFSQVGFVSSSSVGLSQVHARIDSLGFAVQTVAASYAASQPRVDSLGKYVSSIVATPGVSLTTNTAKTVTSILLPQGKWDVGGQVCFTLSSVTSTSQKFGSSLTTNALDNDTTWNETSVPISILTSTLKGNIPERGVTVMDTTRVYLVASATFTLGSVSAWGIIRARRAQ